eukprot:TRINITY_DN5871_c0_g1_i1.p1 TRINITY_DN5871_c0_g1~~TRINITY_DN5871_c0_g1_i1.p1  ORF type:complete len:457 (+),score=98.07 TRINITY_DN5871_c0_g1_i1:301-1671(+)
MSVEDALRLEPGVETPSSLYFQQTQLYFYDLPDIRSNGEFLRLEIRGKLSSGSISLHGKKDSPPTFLDYDLTERDLPGGEFALTLSKYTQPKLAPGRWFFEIRSKAFKSSCSFVLTLSTEGDRSFNQTLDNVAYEIVYENQQRLTPFSEYGPESLIVWPPWSDEFGDARPCKEDTPLPDSLNWYWSSPWQIVGVSVQLPQEISKGVRYEVDKEGWTYATSWGLGNWVTYNTPTSFVRRRIWLIERRVKTREMKQKDMEDEEKRTPEAISNLISDFAVVDNEPEPQTTRNVTSTPNPSLPYVTPQSLQSLLVPVVQPPMCAEELKARLGLQESVKKALLEDTNRPSLASSLSESLTSLRLSAETTQFPATLVTPFDTGCKSSVLEQIELRAQQREEEQRRRRDEMKKSREEARKKREVENALREKQKCELEERMKQQENELESFEAQLKRQLEEEQK